MEYQIMNQQNWLWMILEYLNNGVSAEKVRNRMVAIMQAKIKMGVISVKQYCLNQKF